MKVPLIHVDDVNWMPTDAQSALESLEEVTRRLDARGDRRAIFLTVYAIVTRRVVELLATEHKGGFLDPDWLSKLTGLFAADALVAVRKSLIGEPIRSAAWRLATHYPANDMTLPYQDALLGVNAHINHDLALVVYDDLSQRLPLSGEQLARYEHDFDQVNQILRDSIRECIEMLVGKYDCTRTRKLVRIPGSMPVVERMIYHSLVVWRRRVWTTVVALMNADSNDERSHLVAALDISAGRIAQCICIDTIIGELLRGRAIPFSLARASEYWPGAQSERIGGYGISRQAVLQLSVDALHQSAS